MKSMRGVVVVFGCVMLGEIAFFTIPLKESPAGEDGSIGRQGSYRGQHEPFYLIYEMNPQLDLLIY